MGTYLSSGENLGGKGSFAITSNTRIQVSVSRGTEIINRHIKHYNNYYINASLHLSEKKNLKRLSGFPHPSHTHFLRKDKTDTSDV